MRPRGAPLSILCSSVCVLFIYDHRRDDILCDICEVHGSFRGERVGTQLLLLKVFKNALWTTLRSIFLPKMHYIAGFCTYHFIYFGNIPGLPLKRPRYVVPATSFRLARHRSHCSRFDETTTGEACYSVCGYHVYTVDERHLPFKLSTWTRSIRIYTDRALDRRVY